jgi:hypothetical protein
MQAWMTQGLPELDASTEVAQSIVRLILPSTGQQNPLPHKEPGSLARLSRSGAFNVSIGVLFAVGIACAQSGNTDAAADDHVKSEMRAEHIPGLALLVVKSGKF